LGGQETQFEGTLAHKKEVQNVKFIYFSHLKLARVLNIEKVKGKDDFEEQEKEDIKVAFRNRVFAKYIYKSGYRSD
jgi:tRNA A37 threonylcarbamoyltransferase TsaD|tara:strand:- start:1059 stop:1286 length:228 start_codon:yes stop_codon:yes gene_type:complete